MRTLLVPAAVMMLMLSIGMNLRVRRLLGNWRSVARGARREPRPVLRPGGGT